MIDFLINPASREILLDNADIIAVDSAERVAQQIGILLRLWAGEWMLDTSAGIPYQTDVYIKGYDLKRIEAMLRSKIASVPNVIRVDSLSARVDAATRKLAVDFECTTDYGRIIENGVLYG